MAGKASYTIGQVSRITGVSVATLRWWEEKHALLRPQRTARGFRLYSDSDLDAVKAIKLKSEGERIPLRLVQRVLNSEEHPLAGARADGKDRLDAVQRTPTGSPRLDDGASPSQDVREPAADSVSGGGDHKGVLTRLRALSGAAIAFYSTTELDHVLQLVISNARSIFEIDKCIVFLANRWAEPATRNLAKVSLSTQSRVEASEIDRAIFHAVTRHSSSVLQYGALDDAGTVATLLGVTDVVAMPLRMRDELLGTIVLGSEHRRIDFSPEMQELAESFALLAALAIEKAHQFEMVKTSEEKYRRLVERAIDVVFATDCRGRITFVNSAVVSTLSFAPDEVIGHPLLEIVAPASKPVWLKYLRQAQRGYLPKDSYEIDLVRKDGSVANAAISVTGLYKNGLLCACQGILRDVTEKKRIEREIFRRNEELSALHAITDLFPLRLELPNLLDRVLEKVLEVTHLPIGLAFILDEENAMLHLKAFRESSPGMIKPIPKVRLGAGITGRAAVTGDPIFVESMREDPRMVIIAPADQELGSMLAVPLKSGCRVIGVMALMSESRRPFTPHESQLLSTIAYHLGSAVENAWLRERLASHNKGREQADREHPPGDVGQREGLSAREMDVLRLLARGRSGKEIARLLSISDKTVRTHISKIYQKLHVYDRAQLVLYALKLGLVDMTSDIARFQSSSEAT